MVIKNDHRFKSLDGDLLLTTACPIECDFCVYHCNHNKDPKKWMPEKTIRRVAEQYSKNGIGIRIGGGEPFYDLKKLEKCIEILLEYYKPIEILIITSGFFGTDKKRALKYLKIIKKFGLDSIVISSDRFHLKKVPFKNIENIIEVCKKLDIEPILRITIDSESHDLIDKLVKTIVKNDISIEVHTWGFFGRAENLDIESTKSFNKDRKYFFSKLKEIAEKLKAPYDPSYYLTSSPKKSQCKHSSELFLTTFPNGNIYGCSVTSKGSYLGNINNQNIIEMIVKWKDSLPGNFVLSTGITCIAINNYLPDKYKERCEYCKSFPLDCNIEEAIGYKYVKISSKEDFNKVFEKIKNTKNKTLSISFELNENNLNKIFGNKIKSFLNKLNEHKIKYVLSRPLPKCLGINPRLDDPIDCFECRELFKVKNGYVKFCEPSGNINGKHINSYPNRESIFEEFKNKRKNKNPPKICNNCIFMLRGQCDGLCLKK